MSLTDGTTRPIQIVSGSSTTVFTEPNTFTLTLPRSGFQSGKDEVTLKSMTIYYSWFNISQEKNNNRFSYVWPGDGLTHSVVIADGIWQFTEIMTYLKQVFVESGHYLLDADGLKVFYLQLILNPQLYCLSLTVTPLPFSLPTGWLCPYPAAFNFLFGGGKSPQLIVPQTAITSLLGFEAGSYPIIPSSVVYQINSSIPQITDVSSLNILCNLPDNSGFSLYPNILTSFVVPSGQSPGSLITLQPNNPDWVPIKKEQTFTSITVSLVDQLMRPVRIRDPAGFVMILNVRRRQ